MAADLYRVVRTRLGAFGMERTIASEPISRDDAMARFADCVTLRMDRLRVIREADYQPALFGAQVKPGIYRGETPAPIHYRPSSLRTVLSCGEELDELPFQDTTTFRLQDVTCECCLDVVTASP